LWLILFQPTPFLVQVPTKRIRLVARKSRQAPQHFRQVSQSERGLYWRKLCHAFASAHHDEMLAPFGNPLDLLGEMSGSVADGDFVDHATIIGDSRRERQTYGFPSCLHRW
jgi:hypothetical protein